MKKLFTLLFALAVGVSLFAQDAMIEHVQIGDLYYNLDPERLIMCKALNC